MKKWLFIFCSILLLIFITVITSAKPETGIFSEAINFKPTWELSFSTRDTGGRFDYLLYYPDQSQLLSRVSFPQSQRMYLFNGEYFLPGKDLAVRFHYGQSGAGIKGKGTDSDWMNSDSDNVTDYGDFDTYGNQRLVGFDVGRVLDLDERQKLSVFAGWIRRESTNELRNVVYHRLNGIDTGDQPQDDLGSTLNGKFQGIHISLEKERFWTKWAYTAEVGLTVLKTRAFGHWANHEPAWNWADTGYTMGWTVNIGIQYAINPNIKAELGYYAHNARNYIKFLACDEIITGEGLNENGEYLADQVSLRDDLQGIQIGLKIFF